MTSDPQETSNLEQSYKTLHNLMESILDSSLDGIILVDEEGKIRLVTKSSSVFMGLRIVTWSAWTF